MATTLQNQPFPDPLYGCLALTQGLGYRGFARLMECFGKPEAVFNASLAGLFEAYPGLNPKTAAFIVAGPNLAAWNQAVERCAAFGIRVVFPKGPGYPETLLALPAPPPLLFMQGEWRACDARAAALVGTRNPTTYGRQVAFEMARDLARAGATVVSGLAIGIDAAAHAGAVAGDGRTLAVIGCGLDADYPRTNAALRASILRNGAVMSEFPPGEPPQAKNFPRRNRILSALARATVVIEAGAQSGALITAGFARSQGKPVFAVPGSVFSEASAGTHALLRRGVPPMASAQDLLPWLETSPPAPRRRGVAAAAAKAAVPAARVPAREADPVLDLWGGEETCSLDRLEERAREAGLWPPDRALSHLMSSLLRLEIRGQVRRVPGPAFRRAERLSGSLALA